MALNDRKIVGILVEECGNCEERYEGYRRDVMDLITDIVQLEREHRTQRIDIRKRIAEQINVAGQRLAERRESGSSQGDSS